MWNMLFLHKSIQECIHKVSDKASNKKYVTHVRYFLNTFYSFFFFFKYECHVKNKAKLVNSFMK